MGAIPLAHIIAGVQGIAPKVHGQLGLPLKGGQTKGVPAESPKKAAAEQRHGLHQRGNDHRAEACQDVHCTEFPLEETR